MAWTWRMEGAGGGGAPTAEGSAAVFPSQAEAESWIGERWRDLLAGGVERVTLLEDGREVYGPMSLRPAD